MTDNNIELCAGLGYHKLDSDLPYVHIYDRINFGKKAILAANFVEHWGMVAGEPNGEDSSGRAKLKLSAPEDVVNRACEMVDLLYKEAEKRGWLIESPTIEELKAERKKHEDQ
jgi:hypothetical protein